ncbi:[protein-PII] uridylyltransferase [Methylovorus menthalis]|uniref:[protein-PII] uridylyltransferase n=1 Tax=Methylovorus menthalis TaxID=1002227 RepID=UPI001E589E22|nr:[protein-PII] uridylyltransferase [Methylovorus menthalis]MCB4811721.1 [protein-PII] uridylyltransferase [Methylovorus menthalis]
MSQALPETDYASLAKDWRHKLHERQQALQQAFEQSGNTSALLKGHSRFVDQLLQALWQDAGLNHAVCLIAVGGYGRGELFPHSDVDLLILLPDHYDKALDRQIEALVGTFWDIGLAVGHSVRTLSECADEAAKDVTVQTNLLESRWLAGHKDLYEQFQAAFAANMNTQAFFEAKMLEQRQRHAKFNHTPYNLEPNIKESPGGLRDLQTILWITRSLGLGSAWSTLVKHGLISPQEARQVRRHEQYLQMLRIRLHYLAKRREDRLIFDFQNDLAKQLNHVTSRSKRASEQLMHNYYRSAKFIHLMNEILLQLLREKIYPNATPALPINDHFEARNNLLDARYSALLQKNPTTILESFLLLEQHPELTGMSPTLLRTLYRVKKLVNRDFRQNPVNKQLFLDILKQPDGVTNALRRMNRYGILGNYIPAFGRIVGQMQHDLFHVYTVDEHILNVLRNLRRFALPELAHEFPLCSQLFMQFDKPYLLYLGALFHDIAKGRGGDHSTLGAVDAKRFCKAHGLNREDSELVAWLVEAHLIMSSTAQKADLSDPLVIENFARQMGSERRLTALYLLTVADIRGTSPAVWNAWKAKLLENLFTAAQRLMRDASANADCNIEIKLRQQQAEETLSYYGIKKPSYQPLWDQLGPSYFLKHTSQEIAWHSRLLLPHLNSEKPIVRARLSPAGDGIQTMIYMRDRDDLFARICSFFDRMSYNIQEARIHTSRHGYALDSFLVADQSSKSVVYRDLLNFIEYELTQKLMPEQPLETPLQGRLNRQVKHMPISATIHLQREGQSNYHLLDIVAGDRPGLLSQLAHTFLAHGIHLHTAKINTLGNRAEDTFLISGKSGQPLTDNALQKLKEDLSSQL